ncbi:MAG: hypothetical protein ABIE22_04405 [archaeon]
MEEFSRESNTVIGGYNTECDAELLFRAFSNMYERPRNPKGSKRYIVIGGGSETERRDLQDRLRRIMPLDTAYIFLAEVIGREAMHDSHAFNINLDN